MSKVLVSESSLKNIANAIRDKNGLSDTYKPSEITATPKEIWEDLKTHYRLGDNLILEFLPKS